MNINSIICGKPVPPNKILERKAVREAEHQKLLMSGGQCLLYFTMNIPGSIKLFPLAQAGFRVGLEEILALFSSSAIISIQTAEPETGCEAALLLNADPVEAKKKTILLEESHPIGRLFNIDIRGITRRDLGRKPRQCLVCDNAASVCAQKHAHSLDFLTGETVRLLNSYFKNSAADSCAACAARALLYEVSATPKPGLVDRDNSGSHRDMDFFTFLDSSSALTPWFRDFFCIGWDCRETSDEELFERLRFSGQKAEAAMLQATNAVNTHKGLIFSMAILCGAMGKECSEKEDYFSAAPVDAEKLLRRCACLGQCSLSDFAALPKSRTAGERCFVSHQINGARGEAAQGFPTVLSRGLPTLKNSLASGFSLNDAACITLLSIITTTEDTNMIHRSSLEEANNQKTKAGKILASITQKNFREKLTKLDHSYIEKNLSPGGCADLLAITLMFQFLEEKGCIIFAEHPTENMENMENMEKNTEKI